MSRPKEKGVICGSGAWEIGDIEGKPSMKHAYEAGKAVYAEPPPSRAVRQKNKVQRS